MKIFEGHNIYTPVVLSLYDFFVLGFSNKFLWKCSTRKLLSLYNKNVSEHHLDIGVGTGFYLSAAHFPVPDPKVTLLDVNEHCLKVAAQRIQKFNPKRIVANILNDFPLEEKFSSISICYVLHCLSGKLEEKCRIFDKIVAVLNDGGRVFGATIVPEMRTGSIASELLIHFYNNIGVFSNQEDTLEGIVREFERRFDETLIQTVGSVVLFEGKARKS